MGLNWRRRQASRCCVLVVLLGCTAARGQSPGRTPFYLKTGDRVVFYGDSITQQRLYTTFVETYVVTRFPKLDVTFVNSGWGGDRVTGGKGGTVEVRLARDVIPYKPTVVTVMLGMNDGRYRAFDEDLFRTYSNGYREIVRTLQQALPGLRMTLLEPSAYDDVTRDPAAPRTEGSEGPGPPGYNAVLMRYAAFVKQLAAAEGVQAADLNSPLAAVLQIANSRNAAAAQKIVPDRIHPGPSGHLIMAAAILKAWNAPAIVSSVRINAAARTVEQARNARVEDLTAGQGLAWVQTDLALPMPVEMNDPLVALALQCSDFMESLNQESLAVAGLTGPKYTLKIDGQETASFSGQQLGDGVNLALMRTPMRDQAREVQNLTLKHIGIHYARWRAVQVPLEMMPGEADQAIQALDALEAALVRAQHNAAQPRAHRFEILPAP